MQNFQIQTQTIKLLNSSKIFIDNSTNYIIYAFYEKRV